MPGGRGLCRYVTLLWGQFGELSFFVMEFYVGWAFCEKVIEKLTNRGGGVYLWCFIVNPYQMKNIIDTVKNYFSEKELTPEEVAERIEKTQAILDEIKESGIVNELKKLSKEKGRINVYTNSSLVGRHNHSTRLSVDQKEDGNIGLFLEESRQYGSYNEQYG